MPARDWGRKVFWLQMMTEARQADVPTSRAPASASVTFDGRSRGRPDASLFVNGAVG